MRLSTGFLIKKAEKHTKTSQTLIIKRFRLFDKKIVFHRHVDKRQKSPLSANFDEKKAVDNVICVANFALMKDREVLFLTFLRYTYIPFYYKE